MKLFKINGLKNNLKGITIYLILVFILTLCITLCLPSVRDHIHMWVIMHTTPIEVGLDDSTNEFPSQGTW